MRKKDAILILAFGYLLYLGYVTTQTVEMINQIDNKVKAIKK